ncbi:hypothetical protein [Microcoleus sp. D2_18a_D3]|uniref:hypothetical protein n=1 Tax=Microcoleus sp. D2_18a_D3 TaxID=3055330 RepID=UPI002FCF3A5D
MDDRTGSGYSIDNEGVWAQKVKFYDRDEIWPLPANLFPARTAFCSPALPA